MLTDADKLQLDYAAKTNAAVRKLMELHQTEIARLDGEVARLKRVAEEWKRRAVAHGCDADNGDIDCG